MRLARFHVCVISPMLAMVCKDLVDWVKNELLLSVLVSRGSLKILRRRIAPLRDRSTLTTALWGD